MKAESLNINWDYLNPARIFGPILDKELRVSSRRKRNYFLRSVYVVLLALFILYMCLDVLTIQNASSAVTYQVSRSAQIGKQITIAVVWFQFIVSQILAMVMLSSSISDEIHAGTLNVLMTTPVNSFQIIIGKFVSKLLQVFLLLAISFPLLAIIRVFGGVPWSYVVFSLIITFTSVIFAGSLSLFLSVFNRYAYRVIVLEIAGYILVFGVLPFCLVYLRLRNTGGAIPDILWLSNPFWALFSDTQRMSSGPVFDGFRIVHCLFMLCISMLFLGVSIWKVRSVALNNVSVKHKNIESKKVIKDEKGEEVAHYYEFSGHIRRVNDPPIIWKEKSQNYFGKHTTDKVVTIMLILLFSIIAVSFLFGSRGVSTIFTSITMVIMNFIIMLRLAISTAGSITGEKEARTLPILLVTPLSDKDIIFGKVKAGLLKNIPLLILIVFLRFLSALIFGLRGLIGFPQLLYMFFVVLVSIASMILFVTGCGAYFGVRMKNSTAAIAATIGIYFIVDLIVGNIVGLLTITFLTRLLSPPIVAFYSFAALIIRVIFLGCLGLYLLKLSVRKLRYNIF